MGSALPGAPYYSGKISYYVSQLLSSCLATQCALSRKINITADWSRLTLVHYSISSSNYYRSMQSCESRWRTSFTTQSKISTVMIVSSNRSASGKNKRGTRHYPYGTLIILNPFRGSGTYTSHFPTSHLFFGRFLSISDTFHLV